LTANSVLLIIIAVLFTIMMVTGCNDWVSKNLDYDERDSGIDGEKQPVIPPVIPGVDYTKLKLNEVSGVGGDSEKFYELKNIGTQNIPLEGCEIYYNANGSTGGALPTGDGNLTWTGSAGQTAAAGQLFSLIGRNTEGSFTTGLTAQRILIITLKDPAGNVIDQCIRAEDTGEYAITDKSFSRIPDGTGPFYFTTPTPDGTNGASTSGLTLVPQAPLAAPPVIPGVDYTKLKLNEICGDQKFVEIYNSGSLAISMQDVKLDRNDGQSSWTGTASDSIPAGAYRLILFNSFTAGLDSNPAYTGWTVSSGISDQQTLKIALINPQGNPIDVFMRGTSPWQSTSGVTRERDYSYSRMTDNTWANATPTPGVVNGEKVKDIENPGYSTAP
jgi:hypothetical protein